MKPGEDEIEGLKRRLDDRLAPPAESRQFNTSHGMDNDWEIGDCLAQWWRPNFETFMVRVFFSSTVSAAHVHTDVHSTANNHRCGFSRVLCVGCIVSLCSRTYHQAERMQEAIPCADA